MRKRDAETFLSRVESSKNAASYIDPARARVRIGPWADEWLAGKTNLTPKTRDRYENAIRVHIQPRWGGYTIDQVTHSDVQQWIASIRLAPASVHKIHRVFSQILATAVRDGRIGRNVVLFRWVKYQIVERFIGGAAIAEAVFGLLDRDDTDADGNTAELAGSR